jgi:hypothetical protein
MRSLFILVALAMLAACQPLPQPFQHAEPLDPKLTALKDTYGVRIEPIAGLPAPIADRLGAAMVQAFEDEDVPAAINGGNQRSFRLRASASLVPTSGGVSTLKVAWEVADPAGAVLGRSEQSLPLAGGVLTREAASVLAHRAVAELSPHVTDAPPVVARTDAVIVWSIDGAPGDGKTSLKRAVEYVLRENKVPVADTKQDNASLLLATVEAAKPKDGKQDFSIRWVLMRPDGSEVGAVEQHNAIPAGLLNGTWGDTALIIAEAAYDGIAALIEAERTRN